MKNFKFVIALYGAIFLTFIGLETVWNDSFAKEETIEMEEAVEKIVKTVDPWDLFIEAIIWQESRGNASAVGDNGRAVGVLQIHPIMVREANRIIAINGGEKDRYSYDDRYSKESSIEMFKVVQDYHNKDHNLNKALQIWNHNHPASYRNNIFSKYNDYLNEHENARDNVPGSI